LASKIVENVDRGKQLVHENRITIHEVTKAFIISSGHFTAFGKDNLKMCWIAAKPEHRPLLTLPCQ
jgi:hypothetical protein